MLSGIAPEGSMRTLCGGDLGDAVTTYKAEMVLKARLLGI